MQDARYFMLIIACGSPGFGFLSETKPCTFSKNVLGGPGGPTNPLGNAGNQVAMCQDSEGSVHATRPVHTRHPL